MQQQLVTLHLIEPGSAGGQSLFEVSLMLDDSTRAALLGGDAGEWREALQRARRLIGDHVDDHRPIV